MQEMRRTVLDLVTITVHIVAVKITDFILQTIVNIIQVIQRVTAFSCRPMFTLEDCSLCIFTYSGHIVKALVFRLILVGIRSITGTHHQGVSCIVSPAIVNSRDCV